MDEFPSNSHNKKEPDKSPQVEKNIERVVVGKVTQRKKGLRKRFAETFTVADNKSVAEYIVFDMILPDVKHLIYDVFSQGMERKLFPDSSPRGRSRGRGQSGLGNSNFVNYNSRYSPIITRMGGGGREEQRPQLSRRARGTHDFSEIVLETRAEAEEVIDRLFGLISQYEMVSVSDLYTMVNIAADFTDEKWGWVNMEGAGVRRVRDGYLLNLPRPEPLD